jgi:Icc-related predicted phosphoesterase
MEKRMTDQKEHVRLAAVADIHCSKTSQDALRPLFTQIDDHADILVLGGDLTDYGLPEEAEILVEELADVHVPIVAVFGNHDYEAEQVDELKQIFCERGITILDGDTCEIHGISFAGIKGFGGGFGQGTLGYWGEPAIKRFVQEALDETLRLEAALARLQTEQRVAILHYAPIRETVEGEPPEIFPFLGCSRLEEPLNRSPVTAVLHGHAHAGAPEGRTSSDVPVYNVSLPVLQRAFPNQPPFRILKLPYTA